MKNKIKSYTLLATSLLALSPFAALAEESVGQTLSQVEEQVVADEINPSSAYTYGIGGWNSEETFESEFAKGNSIVTPQSDGTYTINKTLSITLEAVDNAWNYFHSGDYNTIKLDDYIIAEQGNNVSLDQTVDLTGPLVIEHNGVTYYLVHPLSTADNVMLVKDYPDAYGVSTLKELIDMHYFTNPGRFYISADDYNKLYSGAAAGAGNVSSEETTSEADSSQASSSEVDAKDASKDGKGVSKSDESDSNDASEEAVTLKNSSSKPSQGSTKAEPVKEEKSVMARLLPNTGDQVKLTAVLAGTLVVVAAVATFIFKKKS